MYFNALYNVLVFSTSAHFQGKNREDIIQEETVLHSASERGGKM